MSTGSVWFISIHHLVHHGSFFKHQIWTNIKIWCSWQYKQFEQSRCEANRHPEGPLELKTFWMFTLPLERGRKVDRWETQITAKHCNSSAAYQPSWWLSVGRCSERRWNTGMTLSFTNLSSPHECLCRTTVCSQWHLIFCTLFCWLSFIHTFLSFLSL